MTQAPSSEGLQPFTLMHEHFISENACNFLMRQQLITPQQHAIMLAGCKSARELQRLKEWATQRRLSNAWLEKEAELLAKKQWDTHHVFSGYACLCRFCGKSALQCKAEGFELQCSVRNASQLL